MPHTAQAQDLHVRSQHTASFTDRWDKQEPTAEVLDTKRTQPHMAPNPY